MRTQRRIARPLSETSGDTVIEFVGDIARKTGDGHLLEIEFEETTRGRDIGARTGLFLVPKIRNFDPGGVLDFERLTGLIPLAHLARANSTETMRLFCRAGQALAAIHANLTLPDSLKKSFPSPWTSDTGRTVFVHGDYTTHNVCFHPATGQLVILDWATTALLDPTWTYGPAYFDLAWFALNLFNTATLRCLLRWHFGEMVSSFLQTYAQHSGQPFEPEIFNRLGTIMRHLYQREFRNLLKRRRWPKRLLLQALQVGIDRKWQRYTSGGLV